MTAGRQKTKYTVELQALGRVVDIFGVIEKNNYCE